MKQEKLEYKVRLKDFIPIKGLMNYFDRNDEEKRSFRSTLTECSIAAYNTTLIIVPLCIGWYHAVKGVASLLW